MIDTEFRQFFLMYMPKVAVENAGCGVRWSLAMAER